MGARPIIREPNSCHLTNFPLLAWSDCELEGGVEVLCAGEAGLDFAKGKSFSVKIDEVEFTISGTVIMVKQVEPEA